jgi:HK97 gp10 family phage protein
MADDFAFEVPGLAAFEQKLLAMSTVVARGLGRAALRQGTNVITIEARARANKKTGLLRRSIYTKDGGVVGPNIVFSVNLKRNAFYGKFLEFGTSKMHPYPWMRPAAESKAQESAAMTATVLGRGIEMQWSVGTWG